MPPDRVHVNDSIQRFDEKCWLIGQKLLLSRQPSASSSSSSSPSWPYSTELPRVYAAGDQSAVWRAGEAFIKIHDIRHPRTAREHVTLGFLQDKKPLGFETPDVLYHGERDDRYYLILGRVPGQTLTEAWPTMGEPLQQHYIGRVAEICGQMSKWKGEAVCGVDGAQLLEEYLTAKDNSLEHLQKSCAEMGMDMSSLVFYHCDLGPGNILVDPATRGIGIIDWELAGYVPRAWIRTKFHLSSGMDFPTGDEGSKSDWRRLVARKLAEMGFAE